MRALPVAQTKVATIFGNFGPNEGGHNFRYFFLLSFFLLVVGVVLTTAIQNHRRGYRRVSNFCMGS